MESPRINRILLSSLVVLIFLSLEAQKPTLVIPRGHALKVIQIEPSFDYQLVATIDDSPIIHIWDANTNREYYQFYDHEFGLVNVDFHPNELGLISSDKGGNVFIWNLSKTKVEKRIKIDGPAFARYSVDGHSIITARDGLLQFWNVDNTKELRSVPFEGAVSSMTVSSNDGDIFIGTHAGEVYHFDSEGELLTSVKVGTQPIQAMVDFHQQSRLGVASLSGKITLFDLEQSNVVAEVTCFKKGAFGLALQEQNGQLIAVGNDEDAYVRFLNAETLKDETPKRFKWASVPKDDYGLKALAIGDSAKQFMYISDHDDFIVKWDMVDKEWEKGIFWGTLRPICQMDFDQKREKLIIASWHKPLKIFDLTGGTNPVLLEGHSRGTNFVDYHPDLNVAVSIGNDAELSIWNTDTKELIERYNKIVHYDSRVFFTTGHNFLWRKDANEYELVNYKTGEEKILKLADVLDYKLSADGASIYFRTPDALLIFDAFDLKRQGIVDISGITDFSFFDDGLYALDTQGKVYLIRGETIEKTFSLEQDADRIYALDNGEFVTYQSKPLLRLSTSAYHYQVDGNLKSTMSGHFDFITDIITVNQRLLTSSRDGTIKIWKKNSDNIYEEIGTWILLRYEKFVLTTPNQLFDAPSNAMKELHYLLNGEVVDVEQLKDTYYEPNLMAKLVGFIDEELRKPKQLSDLGIYPAFEIQHPNLNNGLLGINLTNKGGGIGKVVLVINGKEVSNDVRDISDGDAQKMGISYDIKGHPYLKNGINTIEIKAYNKDGTLGSDTKTIKVIYEDKDEHKPRVYAVVTGVSDYKGDDLDLKYAAKDARDFAKALDTSAKNMIGGDNLQISLLTTDQENPDMQPTKTNIKRVFEKFSKEASARDYLIIYIAGHGVNAKEEDGGDFLYLTADAEDDDFSDPAIREQCTISSYEFTELIKSVPALKQAMIVDACHSGTLMSTIDKKKSKTMSSSEVRAFERIKDRTGLFLLAGSASDAVSYETTLYGQGLLTYALLFGMKGAALRDGEYVDVLSLFQFAAKKVPELAKDIGGIQRPEIRVPNGVSSFDIGILDDKDKDEIDLVSPKPVFVQTHFQETELFADVLEISHLLDRKLQETSAIPNAPVVFVDDKKFSGALQVRGRYTNSEQLLIGDVKVFSNNKMILEFKAQGANSQVLTERIYRRLIQLAESGGGI